MSKQFKLYWMRETGCHAGTLLPATELATTGVDPGSCNRLLTLANDSATDIVRLHLPFMDQREWRRRAEVLGKTKFVREGDLIRNVPASPGAAMRDRAAHLLTADPSWQMAPRERDLQFFPVWQRVSVALQRAFREWVSEIYFRDITRFEDRTHAYPIIVYQASRPCFGRPRTEFTYDAADPDSLKAAWRLTGRVLKDNLALIEQRLHAAGKSALARRYAPIWAEDIMRSVNLCPRPFIELVAQESAVINALIEMGASQSLQAVKPFSKTASTSLRRMAGMDLRALGLKALAETTRTLADIAEGRSQECSWRKAS